MVVGKLVVASFPVFLASELRFAAAAAILVPLLVAREGGIPRLTARDWAIVFLQALTGVFLFSLFLLYGLTLTTAAASGIITSTTPAVIAALSFLVLRERLRWPEWAGVGCAVAGVLAISAAGDAADASTGPRPALGNALVFGAVVGEALFTILGKAVAGRVSPLATATLVTTFGAALFLPVALAEARGFDFAAVGPRGWLAVLYYAAVVTVLGFVLWFRGVAQVPAGTAAAFTGLLPISAVGLAYILLGEPVRWTHLVGAAFVLAGIGLIARGSRATQEAVVSIAESP